MAIIAGNCPSLRVTVVDVDAPRISNWNAPSIPIKERQLQDIVARILRFCTRYSWRRPRLYCRRHPDGDFRHWRRPRRLLEHAGRLIGKYAQHFLIVAEKSTVPAGMCRGIRTLLAPNTKPGIDFQVLSNAEFSATGDMLHPDGHEESFAGSPPRSSSSRSPCNGSIRSTV
jgi:UDPglucose 6-dehydrogenase